MVPTRTIEQIQARICHFRHNEVTIDPAVLEIVKHSQVRQQSFRLPWTKMENEKFVEALKLHGKDWGKVTLHVFTRSLKQNRAHYYKMMEKFQKYSPTDPSDFLTFLQRHH